jgi:SAM-dependent methyltransferase
MKFIKYFFYIGWNWSFSLAWFIVKHEIRGEEKYGIETVGIDDLRTSVPSEELEHASIYQPVNYYTAERLFESIDREDLQGAFLDVGCGKGRVLALAAAYGFTDIIGIDFSPKLCHEAIALADEVEHKYPSANITIDCLDAREYDIPENVSVIFMFNPFNDLVMTDFLERVSETLLDYPRKLKVLYANPQCKKQWLNAGFEEISAFKKMEYLQGSVLVKKGIG